MKDCNNIEESPKPERQRLVRLATAWIVLYRLSLFSLLMGLITSVTGCGDNAETARERIAALKLNFSEEDFVSAIRQGDKTAVSLFLKAGMDPNLKYKYDDVETPVLCFAIINNQHEVAHLLLKAGAGPNATDSAATCSSLEWAIMSSTSDMVALLLKYKADPNLKVEHGSPPLAAACSEDFHRASQMEPGMVLALLKAGADVNGTDGDGNSALINSCCYTNEANMGQISQIVASLLAAGANVNATNSEGQTALMMAAGRAHPSLVRQLLASGAESKLISKNGAIAVDFAMVEQEENRIGNTIVKLSHMDDTERGETLKHISYESNNLQEVVGLLRNAR